MSLRQKIEIDGVEVSLSPNEFKLVELLMMHRGHRISMVQFVEYLYPDPDLEPDWAVSAISVYFYRIRGKIGRGIISRHPSLGYLIEKEPE